MKKILLLLIFFFLFLNIPFYASAISTPVAGKQIKILLVPGHDNEIWGAQYKKVKEADMNLYLATKIFNLLKKDKRFKVYITRNNLGYTKEFADYFSSKKEEILSFKENAKKTTKEKITNGSFVKKVTVQHISVNADTALKLYGLNKWVNDNNIDAVIHIHFNDYPRKDAWTNGIHKGFAIYFPEEQMINSKESNKFAKSIFLELHKKYSTSTYEKELGGLVSDQNLIALGANNTLSENVKSILIEYGYIYRFGDSAMRHKSYTTMANLTFAGIKKYYFGK